MAEAVVVKGGTSGAGLVRMETEEGEGGMRVGVVDDAEDRGEKEGGGLCSTLNR